MTITKLTLGPIDVNCYILKYSENKAAIVDPGDKGEAIAAELEKQGLVPEKILLTHGHFDHMGAAAFLKEKYKIPLYISEKDNAMLNDREKSGAFLAPFLKFNPVTADGFLKEGDIIELGESKLRVMETPGHSEGSVCFMGEDFIMAGDTIFNGSAGRTDLYSGNGQKLMQSLKRLARLEKNYRLYCGHGGDTELEREKSFNPFLDI
ncbi:MAG TPA: MBL fold metallo-hydrolase [Ruminococcaceae bacterium]|nr:MBL fold metallo-hydrolase [Oscillospiraceae bacterium]